MAGGNIHCGPFEAGDKSGSAFECVLNDLRTQIVEIAEDISLQLEENDYVLLSPVQAGKLVDPLKKYIDHLVAEIGHENWSQEIENEEKAGLDPVEGKWGKSRGWRLYCAKDLLGACQTSLIENEPVCIAFS